jgi:hypothetical protein
VGKDKPTRKDAESAAADLAAKAVKAARSGDTDKAQELADKAALARKLLSGQEGE